MSTAEEVFLSGLPSRTRYVVRVICDCGSAGRSKESVSVRVLTTSREFARLAEHLKHISRRMNSKSPSVYQLPLTEEDMEIDGCRKYDFGKETSRPNRTIMLLGATGAGKTTLINGMINYIVGVEWKDTFRFQIVCEDQTRSQAHSQTSEVTVYRVHHQEGFQIPFTLTVVDTPGFGGVKGIARDREITEQIRRLFTSVNGVGEIDAVCFVTQASLARLSATQRFVFDSVLSIFGKDVEENIEMLVTFADGKQPPVLEAVNASEIQCPKNDFGLPVHFKFNNSAWFAHKRGSGRGSGRDGGSGGGGGRGGGGSGGGGRGRGSGRDGGSDGGGGSRGSGGGSARGGRGSGGGAVAAAAGQGWGQQRQGQQQGQGQRRGGRWRRGGVAAVAAAGAVAAVAAAAIHFISGQYSLNTEVSQT
ncbi:uncharacterized protein LOC130190883 [Pseudoliparis swirei]|uniref:uncharacterized protein LOC130190883 n=1 Tax=Pseudoliparis swirei TaxID=2059687 RepID=UPI0024BDF639|nr:uncharacterized protein LOC130190883 [Pseudoliparis swirei]